MSDRRIAITGLGAVSCLGSDLRTTWEGVLQSRSGIRPLTLFDASAFRSRIGGECVDFDPGKWMTGKEARRMDRFSQFAVAAAEMAFEDSGLSLDEEDPTRIGCILGSGIGGLAEIEAQFTELTTKGPDRVSPFLVPKMMANAAPGQVSIRHGLKGPNAAVVTACASAGHAIGEAMNIIRGGTADIVVTGGSEAAVTPLGVSGFCSLKALSKRNDDPATASRPFDGERDGFVIAEGGAILIIEELERARKRGATIYAELVGFGMSGDGSHITQPDPSGEGPAKSMVDALTDAGLNPDEVTYVNAHGTSTQLNDKTETLAIKKVFGDHARSLAVSSTKSQLGHTLGASGALELVVTSLGIQNRVAPPTINYSTPDPDCDLDYIPNEPREMDIEVAMSNSFGFGGHNATLIARRLA